MFRKLLEKSCSLVLAITLVVSLSGTAFAEASPQKKESMKQVLLSTAYEQVVSYASQNNIELGMSFDDFVNSYDGQPIKDYLNAYYSVLQPEPAEVRSSSSSGGSKYYYNTGTSCPSQANYNKYNLLNVVHKGDVIFEANGGYGITGHIAIVEGIYSRNDGTGRTFV